MEIDKHEVEKYIIYELEFNVVWLNIQENGKCASTSKLEQWNDGYNAQKMSLSILVKMDLQEAIFHTKLRVHWS